MHKLASNAEVDHLSPRQINLFGAAVTLPPPQARQFELSELVVSNAIQPTTAFVENVRQFGVLTPIVVLDDGRKCIVADGRRRLLAAQKVGLNSIAAAVYAINSFMPDVMSMLLNEQRHDNPLADFHAIQRLQERGANEQAICAATGMSLPRLRRRAKLGLLNPILFQSFSNGQMSVAVAEACAGLPHEQQQQLLVPLHQSGTLKHGDIQAVKHARRDAGLNALLDLGLGSLLTATPYPPLPDILGSLSHTTLLSMRTELPNIAAFEPVRRLIEKCLVTHNIPYAKAS